MLDIPADLLGPDEPDFELRVINVRQIRTAADRNMVAGLGHLFDGGLLEAAFGQSESQYVFPGRLSSALHYS